MKILYHHRIRSKDGQFVHIEEMVAALRALGHEVVMVAPPAVEKEAFGADGGLASALKRRLPGAVYELLELAYNAVAFTRLLRACLRERPDGIYERYNLFLVAGAWVKAITGLPLLVEINAPLSEERARYGGLALPRLARWSERHIWTRADRVLPVTQVLAQWPKQAGVPDERITVVPNGIDQARFAGDVDSEAAKAALGLAGKVVLGFTGFIRDWHRLDRVIDYLADAGRDTAVHLLIAGDGDEAANLSALAARRGVADRMTLLGLVPRERIANVVAAFDIALQPAVTAYASPLKMLEYMALGRAIVAPDRPNIRELLRHGHNGLLFNPDDPDAMANAIDDLVRAPQLRRRIGDAARMTTVERDLTWRHNAQIAARLLKTVAGERRKR